MTVTGTNSTGQSVSDEFLFAVIQVTQAPTVQTVPTISGSTTVGSILTRTAGTATGIPTPTRATEWLVNDAIITAQTGNTFDTTGFAAGDDVRTRDRWTSTINGEVITVYGSSEVWTLTAPTVQPVTLVQNLSNVTLTQGTGDFVLQLGDNFANETGFTFSPATPPAGVTYQAAAIVFDASVVRSPVTITVTATGANGSTAQSSTTYSVVAASTTPGDDLVVYAPDATAQIDAAPTGNTTVTIDPPHVHAGTYTITAAMKADMANGPIALVAPAIEIDADLTEYRVTKIGLWVWDAARGSVTIQKLWRQNGVTISGQVGQTLPFSETYRSKPVVQVERALQGGLTPRDQPSNAVTVAASYRLADTFAATPDVALTSFVGASGETWTKIYDDTDPAKTNTEIIVTSDHLKGGDTNGDVYIRGAADRGPKQFAEADFVGGSATGQVGHVIGVFMAGTNCYGLTLRTANSGATPPYPGRALLYRYVNNANTVLAEWDVDLPVSGIRKGRVEVDRTSGQPVLRVYHEGALVGTYTDTSGSALSGGGVGVRARVSMSGFATRLKTFHGGSL